MGKIADLMQQYLDTVSREQLEQDVAEIKALGLVGPSMREFRDSFREGTEFVYKQEVRISHCFTYDEKDLCAAA